MNWLVQRGSYGFKIEGTRPPIVVKCQKYWCTIHYYLVSCLGKSNLISVDDIEDFAYYETAHSSKVIVYAIWNRSIVEDFPNYKIAHNSTLSRFDILDEPATSFG